MRFGSLFAGIGGFDLGLERAGMSVKWQVEVDPFCQRVLERHWPNVRRLEDVREVGEHNLESVDLICGGFPCTDVSVAGRRAGLAGEQSRLWFEFERIIGEMRPDWVVIENVPGLLSSNKGKDFELIVTSLAELGYGVAWRVLDSQYFRVPQRRRRVFLVGSAGRLKRGAGEVLFEPESCGGYPPPSREKRYVSASLLASGAGTSRTAGIGSEADFLVPVGYQGRDDVSHAIRAQASRADKPSSSTYVVAPTLTSKNDYASSSTTRREWQELSAELFGAVRRLTPVECERLQGFPDGWTAVDGDKTPDTPRYKAIGNAVTVSVAEWIGRRIMRYAR